MDGFFKSRGVPIVKWACWWTWSIGITGSKVIGHLILFPVSHDCGGRLEFALSSVVRQLSDHFCLEVQIGFSKTEESVNFGIR